MTTEHVSGEIEKSRKDLITILNLTDEDIQAMGDENLSLRNRLEIAETRLATAEGLLRRMSVGRTTHDGPHLHERLSISEAEAEYVESLNDNTSVSLPESPSDETPVHDSPRANRSVERQLESERRIVDQLRSDLRHMESRHVETKLRLGMAEGLLRKMDFGRNLDAQEAPYVIARRAITAAEADYLRSLSPEDRLPDEVLDAPDEAKPNPARRVAQDRLRQIFELSERLEMAEALLRRVIGDRQLVDHLSDFRTYLFRPDEAEFAYLKGLATQPNTEPEGESADG